MCATYCDILNKDERISNSKSNSRFKTFLKNCEIHVFKQHPVRSIETGKLLLDPKFQNGEGEGGKSNILKNKYINFQCNFLTMSEKSGGTSSLKNLIFYKRIVNKILLPPPRAPCCYRPRTKKWPWLYFWLRFFVILTILSYHVLFIIS